VKTLSEEEAALVKVAFFEGPAALIEAGIPAEAVRAFFEREDVQYEMGVLKRELDHHDALQARAKFVARRNLHRLIDPATAVITMALAGPQYQRDKKTNTVLRDSRGNYMVEQPEPTKVQLDAAKTVMQGVGINDFRISADPGSDNQLDVLFRKSEEARTVDYQVLGQSEEERVLARERVRTAIARIAPRLPAAREEFREQFQEAMNGGGGKRKAKKKTAKKAGKKTGTKKRVARKRSASRGTTKKT
jgi:hypothetical protein